MRWHVIYTKSRFEKAVAQKLNEANIEAYCPVLKTQRKWSDRYRWVEEPLFRSYCFVRISDQDRNRIYSVNGVVKYLTDCGRPAIVRDHEIDVVKQWLNEFSHEAVLTESFFEKDRVRLGNGILLGREAEIVEVGKKCLILELAVLGVQIKVDLRKNNLVKLNS